MSETQVNTQENDQKAPDAPVKKKRGRPLGSKNKLKAKIAAIANEVDNNG